MSEQTTPGTEGTRRIAVVSAGLSDPSSTRLLADRIIAATTERLRERGEAAQVRVIELREHAHAITDHLLTGFAPKTLAEELAVLAETDAIVVVTPIFTTSYSGLFKSFVDILDRDALAGKPVLLAATAGTVRHSLAIDYAIRPLFTYLRMRPLPTGVFAASSDWGGEADRVAPLQQRIDRGAEELVEALIGAAASGSSVAAADPYDPATYLGENGSFADLLNTLPERG